MSKYPDWTDEDDATLADLFRRGLSFAQMAPAFAGRDLGALAARAKFLGLSRAEAALPRQLVRESQPNGCGVAFDPRRATLEHLLDLKRAGHSWRRTEYRIAPDGASSVTVAPRPPVGSYCGSASALCVDFG